MNRFLRTFDWRLFLSIGVAVAVIYLAFVGYSGVQESREKDERIDALISEIERDSLEDARHEREEFRNDRSNDRVRADLLRMQRKLIDLNIALNKRQTAILEYLSRLGIEVPVEILEGGNVDRVIAEIEREAATMSTPSAPRQTQPSTPRSHSGGSGGGAGSAPGQSANPGAPGRGSPPRHAGRPRSPGKSGR